MSWRHHHDSTMQHLHCKNTPNSHIYVATAGLSCAYLVFLQFEGRIREHIIFSLLSLDLRYETEKEYICTDVKIILY